MQVLFLSTWFPYPADNGSKIRVYHLLQALGTRHTVTLISFAFDTATPQAAPSPGPCAEVHVVWRNPFERSRISRGLRFLSLSPVTMLPVAEMTQAVRHLLAQTNFDVVIASCEVMTSYALLVPWPTIKVLEEHNSLTRWMWERQREQVSTIQRLRCWVSWQKSRYYESRVFRQFDLCTMVSELDRKISAQALGDGRRVAVVPNGVDCNRNYLGLAPRTPNTLIFNGALTYSANYNAIHYFLAEVYPLIRHMVPDVSLTITGPTGGVNLSGLPLDESVYFSGCVDDVRPLVAGASVCVVPICQGGGTRLKILEAMALGTPVVSTRKGAEGLDVIDREHILLADDPVTFAEHTVRLFCDPALCQRLTSNARRLVEQHYDWAQIGHRFVELVEEVASRRAREGNL
jgi:glycosyltransferase involved in cell wall biosynthesis